ncbi:translation elongation factor Ts [Criibacterium bergeronii]|uniref:Elongation factor Ts n=1 Tax=Criibacterium bergeronii TaxID=1871336 RepID=A0A371IP93_9FIRM|nr:translation elongation factor Ts [Criibacterium bergeronii]MBS6063378.1 elongation factor Ts [Peptostreptococcaceae bacterium]RDY22260.1 elongation factor Ts [Criibacterium bergeronii]
MEITAQMVKTLREKTGAGMMDCKKALTEVDGDMDKAIDLLREKGLSKAAKKADRIAAEGLVGLQVSSDNKTASIVEVNSETDFVSKNEEFKTFVNDIVSLILEKQPADMPALMAASFNGHTVQDDLNEKISKIGENLSVRRFELVKATNGRVIGYVHGGGKIGTLIQLDTDSTDAKIEELGKDIAMQVAAMNPKYISDADVDQAYLDHEREVLKQQALNENNELPEDRRKPEEIVMKMLEGRLKKQLKEVCLLDQAFVKESKKSVADVVKEYEKALNTKITVAKMVRFEVGEGIEKKNEDFAEEVAKQMGN